MISQSNNYIKQVIHCIFALLCCVTASGVISVQTALYGRADTETCSDGRPPQQLANTKCSQPGTVDVLRKSCDGKKVCEINTKTIMTSDPCYGIYKYLETTYTCGPAIRSVTCEISSSILKCGKIVIFVYGADYGRRDSTTCSYGRHVYQVTNVHCRGPSKILHLLCIHSCNGKNSCLVSASNSVFGDPCYGTYKYLEVTYRCQCKSLFVFV
uniref:SUEL-type lectin domain-containing protein n=1 Tax=Dicentrarchus labrax TaxID=13489 RepID=A0A8C4IG15_DICLA